MTDTEFYHPRKMADGFWGFRTPTGLSDGYLTETDAKICAVASESQDRQEAEGGSGIIAQALRKHFELEDSQP